MALKISTDVKNGMLNAIETVIGASAVLKIRTGAPPSSISDADTGDEIATLTLPADWMAAASGGSKAKSGTWEDIDAELTGTAGHFRVYASDGITAHIQGTITVTGGGGDMELDNVSISAGQKVTISSFTLTAGN